MQTGIKSSENFKTLGTKRKAYKFLERTERSHSDKQKGLWTLCLQH